jgi:hypothetical protein
MKKILFSAFFVAEVACSGAFAAQVDPETFALAFCAARRHGVATRAAARLATDVAIDLDKPSAPMIGNSPADAKASVRAAFARCPGFFAD